MLIIHINDKKIDLSKSRTSNKLVSDKEISAEEQYRHVSK